MASFNTAFFSVFFLLALTISPLALAATPGNANDKKALLQIKNSFGNSNSLSTWNPKTDCCTWYDIQCNETTGRVTGIIIYNNYDLSGHIPPTVVNLPYLEILSISNQPKITGTIPSNITTLPNFQWIILRNLSLSGPVPSFLGTMKKLFTIDLTNNHFSGTIPPSLGLITAELFLDGNKVTGTIPATFAKTTGRGLHFANNKLSGRIPKFLSTIEIFDLDLSGNQFTGDASYMFNQKSKIWWNLNLSRNRLSFNMSKVTQFAEHLTDLDLSHNMIYGSLMTTLEGEFNTFNVSYNLLCGKIPSSNLKQYDASAYRHNKCLCGTPLPACK